MKNKIVAAFKNQIIVAFIVGGAIIVATAISVFALLRLVCVASIGPSRSLIRPVSEKLNAFRRTENTA